MTEQSDKYDVHFYQLVIGLHAATMQQMGKVASTLTGKIERDLDQARGSIDLLDMLKRKTAGNLSEEEHKLLDHVLYELRMNFVDETKKGEGQKTETEKPSVPDEQEEKAGTETPDTDKKE
jgi:hypothetical protein